VANYFSMCFYLCSSTPLLAAIRKDDSPDLSEVRKILQEHLKVSFPDLHEVKHVFSSNL
jgi:hypothetical protein